jgi:hypothetical protein
MKPMYESAALHFDLGHLEPDQPFTLHAGARQYDLAPHTAHTRNLARRKNAALRLLEDHQITHFAEPVRVPGNSPLLLRVTAPKRNPDDLLDRLVLTALHLPRRSRIAALSRRRRRLESHPEPLPPQLAAYGTNGGTGLPPDDALIDIGDMNTALDAAASLIFHHCELLTLQATPACDIVNNFIVYADGINALAASILNESQLHEQHPSNPNWAISQPGTNVITGKPDPAHPVYTWSAATMEYLRLPLGDALEQTKNAAELENQCWTVLPGVTQVAMPVVPPGALRDGPDPTYTTKAVTPQYGVSYTLGFDAGTGTATVSLSNTCLRWLQISVDQYGPGNETVGSTQYLGMLSTPDTIMAAPLPTAPTDFPFTFDPGASRAIVSFGGLGQAPMSWDYDGYGISCTAIFCYAIPTAFIALGVAVDQGGEAWSDLTKKVVPMIISTLEAGAEGPLASLVGGGVGLTSVLLAMANLAGALLLSVIASSEALADYITVAAGEGAAEKAEPFLGWAALAIGAGADIASIIETTVAVANSPGTMAIEIDRIMDVAISVGPDAGHQGQWPETATHYTISVTYDDGPVYTYNGTMNTTTQQGPIDHTFTGLPAGGTITVLGAFYSATGWLAGRGTSGSVHASPDESGMLTVPAFNIKENTVPLSATTTYYFKEKLGYSDGNRVWVSPPAISAPTATVTDLDGSNVGNNLGQLGQLTLYEAKSAIGYSWQASGQGAPLVNTGSRPYTGQEFTFQAVSDGSVPQSGLKFSGDGYISKVCLAFPPPTLANPLADGFLLEPATGSSDMMLRALSLTPGQPMIGSPGQSFGRFASAQDDLDIHPSGYAVALNKATCKLQVVRLTGLSADASAPAATIYSGRGTRQGLLEYPVAVSCSLDKVLVLQTTDSDPQGCICAFDIKGNPVSCFAGGEWQTPLHPEGTATVNLVDVSVEAKGYMYVLKYLTPAAGAVLPSDYRLDIYNPDGSFLVQVPGLAAAALHVDIWRNLFTLNYEILPGTGRTEPSVSLWIPSTPPG